MRLRIGLLGFLVACGGGSATAEKGTATDASDTGPTTTVTSDDGFCAVRRIFNRECVVCHSAAGHQGDLDLETDPRAALVNVSSATYGEVLVRPGSPSGSLLYRKMDDTQSGSEGDVMPPQGRMPTAAGVVAQWITDGATAACGTPGTTTEPPPYHPRGWDDPTVHGLATKLQTETDCRECHGTRLTGGTSGIACSDCHDRGWETDCTYCHGGVGSTTGAPPEDIDDNDDPATITFPPHGVHLSHRITAAWGCDECHLEPAEALDPGHLFDDPTPGVAEVALKTGAYTPGVCADNACHGTGRTPGTVTTDAGPRTCVSCHAGVGSGPLQIATMSGRHGDHLAERLACDACHADAQGSLGIDEPALHVNGDADVALPPGMTFDPVRLTCTGTCHFERHAAERW